MVIIIGNQKGGAGKSTFTVLLANYLTMVKKRKVTVLDMDYQQSISSKFEKSKALDNPEFYDVVAIPIDQFPDVYNLLIQDKEQIVLVDLPGKMDDNGLIPVIKAADLIITPFAYDEFTVDSTVLFSMVSKQLNESAPIYFIPNRIKGNVKYETQEAVEKVLSEFGSISTPIAERIDFQRINTYSFPLSLYPVVMPVLDSLYNQFLIEEDKAA